MGQLEDAEQRLMELQTEITEYIAHGLRATPYFFA